jgi:hypothetical protein
VGSGWGLKNSFLVLVLAIVLVPIPVPIPVLVRGNGTTRVQVASYLVSRFTSNIQR